MMHTLTVYLLKKVYKNFEDALEKKGTKYSLRPAVELDGALYVEKTQSVPPGWASFVEQGITGQVDARTQSSSAVLFIRAKERVFAYTFGYGIHMLKDEAYEPHFGLRVALNLVDASRLRSVDARTVEELTLYTRRQASRSTPLGTFGLDVSQDLLRAVTGEPKDPAYARRVTGKDGLVLTSAIEFKDLDKQCAKILEAYNKKDYKENFSWIDRLTSVREPEVLAELDERLVKALNTRTFDRMHMAPPDIVDWDKLHTFRYTLGGTPQEDLDPSAFMDVVGDDLTIDKIKVRRVHGYQEGVEDPIESWAIYKCFVFETNLDSKLYVLSGGLWYHIAKDFAYQVAANLAKIKVSTIVLPDAKASHDEDAYNKHAAKTQGYALLDKKLVKCGGASTSIEICDLLSNKGHLIHVKRHMRSATLSHLIAQGVNSATALIGDPVFRKEARKKVEKGYLKFFPEDSPEPSKYEITYAVIAKAKGDFPKNLPFFSKLTLTRAAENLRRQQFKVTLKLVPIETS